jgi:hypothetical protein
MALPVRSVYHFFRGDPRLRMYAPLNGVLTEYVSEKHGVSNHGSIVPAPGRAGTACYEKTDISGTYRITFGTGSDWLFGTQMTAMIWFFKGPTWGTQTTQYVFSKSDSMNSERWWIGMNTDPALRVSVARSGSLVSRTIPTRIQGSWFHAAITTDGSTLRTFLNGVQVDSANCTINPNHASVPLQVGSWGHASYGYLGQFQEAALFNAPLSPAEIAAYYRYAALPRPERKIHFAIPPPPPPPAAPTGLSVLGGDRKNTISWAWSP